MELENLLDLLLVHLLVHQELVPHHRHLLVVWARGHLESWLHHGDGLRHLRCETSSLEVLEIRLCSHGTCGHRHHSLHRELAHHEGIVELLLLVIRLRHRHVAHLSLQLAELLTLQLELLLVVLLHLLYTLWVHLVRSRFREHLRLFDRLLLLPSLPLVSSLSKWVLCRSSEVIAFLGRLLSLDLRVRHVHVVLLHRAVFVVIFRQDLARLVHLAGVGRGLESADFGFHALDLLHECLFIHFLWW